MKNIHIHSTTWTDALIAAGFDIEYEPNKFGIRIVHAKKNQHVMSYVEAPNYEEYMKLCNQGQDQEE